jgi:hypothetical protein
VVLTLLLGVAPACRAQEQAGSPAEAAAGPARADTEDSAFDEAVGFSRCKRKLAHRLGVDVYSTNQRLQSELDRVCWSTVGGGATFGAVMAIVPLGTAITLVRHTTTFSDKMSDLLVTKSGGDLYRMNREILRGMGMPEASIERFLNDEQLSPRNKTIIVAALQDMRGVEGLHHVVSAGGRIRDEQQALWFQRTVELSRGYHARVSPLRALYVDADQLFLLSEEGDMVAVRAADRWMWTAKNRDWAQRFAAFTPPGVEAREHRFWTGGRFSPAARVALDDLGVEAREDAAACLEAEPPRC